MTQTVRWSLTDFNDLTEADAIATLAPSCASDAWLTAVVAARPYPSLDAVLATSDAAIRDMSWDDVLAALAAHPRIGERAEGDAQEAQWSREEQSAAADGDAELDAALRAGNAAYEHRFGYVFLICSTGLSRTEVLHRLRDRLGNDVDVEAGGVRGELAAIVRLRLARTVG